MIILWVVILFFVIMLRSRQQQEKQICQKPVSLMPSIVQTTEPPRDMNIIDKEMNGATVSMKVGEKRKVVLPGNATTGYAWRIVKMEGQSVKPDDKWHYQLAFPYLTGSGGYFQREFEAVESGQTDIYFIYDPVAEPIRLGYYYFVRFDVHP